MVDFLPFCKQFSPIEDEAADELVHLSKIKSFQKGELLLQSGKVCSHLFFLNEGFAKIFFVNDNKEFIMRFFPENVMFTAFASYLTQTPSNYMIMALEPTTVTLIRRNDMEDLCKRHHSMETFFRKLVSIAAVKMTKRISEMLEKNATTNYNLFVKENGELLQKISLGDLAKYLGITQQSLSRIRTVK
jgi:CRP-like cAMP-binding protein